MSKPVVKLDESTPNRPRLVVEMPAHQREAIRTALAALAEAGDGARIQRIVSEALLTAVERLEADEAVAEGRVRTFDTMDEMIAFLDAQRP